MDFDYIFLWIVAISAGSMLVRFYRSGFQKMKSWIIAAGLVLAIEALGYFLWGVQAGYLAFVAWMLLLILPIFCSRKLAQLIFQQDYSRARFFAGVLSFLHPNQEHRILPRFLKGMSDFHSEHQSEEESLELLRELSQKGGTIGHIAFVQSLAMRGMWRDLRQWIEHDLGIDTLFNYPSIVPHYLRALGELGECSRLLQFARACRETNLFSQSALLQAQFYLITFAFAGERELVQNLLEEELVAFSDDLKRFWLATVDQASDYGLDADRVIFELSESSNASVRYSAQGRRKTKIPVAARILRDADREALQLLARSYVDKPQRSETALSVRSSSQVSVALTVVLFLVYLLELFWDFTHPEYSFSYTLFQLGALLPVAVYEDGEWWRLGAAMFLHGSFAHLATNMLGLFILGPAVESAYGSVRMLLLYILSGVGSLYLVLHLTLIGYLKESLLVGASGAIMGMIGALAAPLVIEGVKNKSLAASEQLRSIIFIVGIQIVFDLSTPQVSSPAHMGGLLTGLVFGFALSIRARTP